ncbi:Inner membrane protein CreD [Roseovarius albus]|uniref:Inner membrane protein CreD n=1 Tax=Roseovarius albus TaxID=1247867 RepID=A0A1X6YRG2_9RHOB|nr:cell envelope integrity protein CreD [Roseovarius albus]SLN28973.1 Inner membrane protein CreD [Roseovarius albus]
MHKSPGYRFFILSVLVVLMTVPVFFVGSVIDKRADYNRVTRYEIGHEWGGRQQLSGPVLVIPVQKTVSVRDKIEVLDPVTGHQMTDVNDKPLYRYKDVERTYNQDSVYIYPDNLSVDVESQSQERRRGIFTVPVYSAQAEMQFDFPYDKATKVLKAKEVLVWDKAEVRFHVSSNRALRGATELLADGKALPLEPSASEIHGKGGIQALTGDPREHERYHLKLGLNGTEALEFTPVGRTSEVSVTSDWAHPEFRGNFLPDGHEVTEAGFAANWTIPHLARSIPQVSREDTDEAARRSSGFGVGFYQPNDFYQKAYRAARYGMLFIGLTFLTIFLVEGASKRPTHPVQYILVGLAQSAFFLLMLALSEQIGFAMAYLVSAGATVALITCFGVVALRLGKRALVLGLAQAVLYTVMYLILRSADYALLAGSILLFAAIAGTMFATRNEDWYGDPEKKAKSGWWRKREVAQPLPQAPAK